MVECLVDLQPLVHWITGPLFGLSGLVLGFVIGRLRRAGVERRLADEVKRWEIVAHYKGWKYTVHPLRATDMGAPQRLLGGTPASPIQTDRETESIR